MRPGGEPYGAVRDGAVVVSEGKIRWLGPATELPPDLAASPADVLDVRGAWLTPGLIDCHTHLVFGGDRSLEFERRLGGATYEEIAREGGGILETVRATRAATADELLRSAAARVAMLSAHGVTTVEVKSGYGLDVESELTMLRVARGLEAACDVRVQTTLLAAHALPPEHASDRAGYLRLVCEEMIPAAASEGLADAVDAFCEHIAFTPEEVARVFRAAEDARLPLRLHADQLSDLGGAALAAEHGARSADHLEYTSVEGVAAMAAAGTAAVLLPGAFYFLREARRPPVEAMRTHGVPIAVATDLNPGSSPLCSPLLAMSFACVLFRLTPEEALAGATRNAAAVLGLDDRLGTLEPGKEADLAIWDVGRPGELSYWVGANPCLGVVRGGRRLERLGD